MHNFGKDTVQTYLPQNVNKHLNMINIRASKGKIRSKAQEKEVVAIESMSAPSKVFGIGRIRYVIFAS